MLIQLTYFSMLMTNRTACTATSYSLSKVMATILSLNLLVKSSNFPFSSSEAYNGCRAYTEKKIDLKNSTSNKIIHKSKINLLQLDHHF